LHAGCRVGQPAVSRAGGSAAAHMPAPPGVYAFDDENWRSRAAALPVPEPKAPEPPSGPALLAAATEGDRDGIKFQLDHDVHVDYSSALSAVSRTCHMHEALGLPPSSSGSPLHHALQGATALHRAAGCGHIACIDLLVERGANLNAQDVRARPALLLLLPAGAPQLS
jgi:hypothetical protein